MLSFEECTELLDVDTIKFENIMIVDSNTNTMTIPDLGMTLSLNEAQKRLLICLIKKFNAKRDIINIVWYENHQRISDNNYHQLAFQIRALLQRSGLPTNLIVTVPYYGMKINESKWRSLIKDHTTESEKNKDAIIKENADTQPEENAEGNSTPKKKHNEKPSYAFMLSFFMLSLVVYWFK